MKQRAALLLALVALGAGLVAAQRQHAHAPVSAQSILYLIADSERDLTRLPSHFTRISDVDEATYGTAMAVRFLNGRGALRHDDALIEKYVTEVGARIARHAHRRFVYQFHYIPDRSFVNAFALPGGHVFIGAGLMEEMTTEDEVAEVLAHEVEHVDHYHCAERLQVEAALRKIPLGAFLQIPVSVFEAGYSKEQELEADREGVLLASHASYSASGALQLFAMLDRMSHENASAARTPQQEAANVAADVLAGYFRSHPETSERIAQVRTMIASQPSLVVAERPLVVQYMFLAWKSRDAIAAEQFAKAVDLATRAVKDHADCVAATQALCESDFGLEHYTDAQNEYRRLIALDAVAADAVEKWAEERAERLSNAKKWDQEIALLESLLTIQPAQPRLLRYAAIAYALKGDGAAATRTATMIRRLYPSDASQLATETSKNATELFDAHDFSTAVTMSRLALDLDPADRTALKTLGNAAFAQAHFTEAADAYKNLFDEDGSDDAWLRSFADTLAAARPRTAAAELDTLFSTHPAKAVTESAVRVEHAGLLLLSGNDAQAREVVQLVDRDTIAPELLARLGWWYLHAGRAADAEAVLRKARSLRPGEASIQNALAWTLLEEGKHLGDEPLPADTSAIDPLFDNAPDVRDALAAWQQRRTSDALAGWSSIARTHPQWLNPAWREALYPRATNTIAQDVEAEQQRIAANTPHRLPRRRH
jgi:predicted Zn-dependent protease